jgi:hypothetical protein
MKKQDNLKEHLVTLENSNGDEDIYPCEASCKSEAKDKAENYLTEKYGDKRNTKDTDYIVTGITLNQDSEYNELKYDKKETELI